MQEQQPPQQLIEQLEGPPSQQAGEGQVVEQLPVHGGSHFHGLRHVVPLQIRQTWLSHIDPDITAIRLHSFRECEVDMLLFVYTGVPPTMRLSATREKTKSGVAALLQREAARIKAQEPLRLFFHRLCRRHERGTGAPKEVGPMGGFSCLREACSIQGDSGMGSRTQWRP
jgi:hypothetical protein